MKVAFKLVRVGEVFNCNGNTYMKRSTRTAMSLGSPLWFYFHQMEPCTI